MCGLIVLALSGALPAAPAPPSLGHPGRPLARVVVVQDPEATEAFQARPERILPMVQRGLTNLTGKPTPAEAWRSLLSTQDVVGLKIFSAAGPRSGTRPAVVAAVIESLLAAGLPPRHIVLWDRHRADLRRAGFFELADRYGVRIEGSVAAGYDEKVSYETPLLGQLIYGDLEFGRKPADGQVLGRKSFVSRLVTAELTKIVSIPPLLNHNHAGVTGNLYGLAMHSIDNNIRFEVDAGRLAEAVPEVLAQTGIADKLVLCIVDALVCQYQGEQTTLLHYATPLNELRFSTDPVALDVLSFQEIQKQRRSVNVHSTTNMLELFQNASLLDFGVSDPGSIQVERVQ